jgi:hypothetical protein
MVRPFCTTSTRILGLYVPIVHVCNCVGFKTLTFFTLVMQGWITTFAWICNVAAAMSVLSNTASGLIIFNNPSYEPQRWHITLLLIGFTLAMTAANFGLRKILNPLENIGGVLHVILFVVIIAVGGTILVLHGLSDYSLRHSQSAVLIAYFI